MQVRGQISDGPARVRRDKLDDFCRLGSEPPHVEFLVQKQGRNVRAVEQVLHVVAGVRKLVHLCLLYTSSTGSLEVLTGLGVTPGMPPK